MLGSYIRAEGVQSEKQALLRISLWASYYIAVFTLLNSQPFGMPLSLPHYKHCGIGRCGSRCSTKKVDMVRICGTVVPEIGLPLRTHCDVFQLKSQDTSRAHFT